MIGIFFTQSFLTGFFDFGVYRAKLISWIFVAVSGRHGFESPLSDKYWNSSMVRAGRLYRQGCGFESLFQYKKMSITHKWWCTLLPSGNRAGLIPVIDSTSGCRIMEAKAKLQAFHVSKESSILSIRSKNKNKYVNLRNKFCSRWNG